MKKIFSLLTIALLTASSLVKAQTPQTTQTTQSSKTTATNSSSSKVVHTKKDGTPDMRYKSNKTAKPATPAGPGKKDGTADMRYKSNKSTVVKKTAIKQ